MRRTGQNTSKIHLTNLKEVMYHYLKAKGADTFDKLAELFLFEQFTQSLNDTVRQFLESKQPKFSDEDAEFADLSYQISRIGKKSNKSNSLGSKPCPDKFGGAPGTKQFGTQPPKQNSQAGDGNANTKSFRQQQSNGQFGKQNSNKPKAGNSENGGYFANPRKESDAMTVNKDTLFEHCDIACGDNANVLNSCNAGNDAYNVPIFFDFYEKL